MECSGGEVVSDGNRWLLEIAVVTERLSVISLLFADL